MFRSPWTALLAVPVVLAVCLPGCGKDEDTRVYRTVEGAIERIDRANSELTLRFYNPKHDREMTITGKAVASTEILINGVESSLADLREGERVSVVGWVKGHGAEREVVAERIAAERADTIRRRPPTTTAPALPRETSPAGR